MAAFLLGVYIFICFVVAAGFTFVHETELTNAHAEDNLQEKHGEIIHSSVLFRHGDRTITKSYPTDPTPASAWPEGYGQLTQAGKKREYQLGQWLRQRYRNNLIKGGYKHDIIRANSSDVDRTLMSAELVLAGLFPPNQKEMWNDENLQWQPIPVHTAPTSFDDVFGITHTISCERYNLEELLVNKSPEFQAFYRDNEDTFQYVSKYSGQEVSSDDVIDAMKHMWLIYDALSIEESRNITLPTWTKQIYPEPLRTVGKFAFAADSHTQMMKKLTAGILLSRLIEDMQMKRNNQLNQTLHLYSGHDATISILLCALNVYNLIPPLYGAAVIIELRQKNDAFIVTILYRNSTTEPPHLLKLPGCNDICTLDEFLELTKDLVLENRQNECQVNAFEKLYYFNQLNQFVFIGAICVLAALIVIFVIKLRHCKKRRRYWEYNKF